MADKEFNKILQSISPDSDKELIGFIRADVQIFLLNLR